METLEHLESDSLEDPIGSVNAIGGIQEVVQSFDEITGLLNERCQFYREENAKLKEAMKKIGVLNQQLCPLAQKALENLTNIQSNFEVKDCNIETVKLSQAERLRKHSNYITKIKTCIKMYANLNERLAKDIKTAKRELENSKCKVNNIGSVSRDELKLLEAKIKRYENELLKFEKKYPWLTNSQYNLPNISKEMETLVKLRQTKEKLLENLEAYHGLKPDIGHAKEQLEEVKAQYEKSNKELMDD